MMKLSHLIALGVLIIMPLWAVESFAQGGASLTARPQQQQPNPNVDDEGMTLKGPSLSTRGQTGLKQETPAEEATSDTAFQRQIDQIMQEPQGMTQVPVQNARPSINSGQTPVSNDRANQFYASCVSQQDPRMTKATQEAMCACNAVMMQQHMSVEDIELMASDAPESRLALNKMLLDVYTPCMNYPVNDLVLKQCLEDPKIDQAGLDIPKDQLCLCMSEQTANWFTDEGRRLMSALLIQNPNMFDPLTPVMESREFKRAALDSLTRCMQNL